jgi:hypothetical protein
MNGADTLAAESPRHQIETYGYFVARGVLSPDEISRLRAALLDHFSRGGAAERLGRHQPGSAVAIPAIAWLFSHPAILASFRTLLGDARLVFCGNCDTHLNILSHWHRDTSEHAGGCFRGDYLSRSTCQVYRAGIYLQDHDTDHLGLKLRRGSHRVRAFRSLPTDRPPTKEGDVAFFDIRLIHAGIVPDPIERLLLIVGRRLRWPRWTQAAKNAYWRLTGKRRKLSAFFTFGLPNADTEDFCRFEMTSRRDRLGAGGVALPATLVAPLEAAGVTTYESELERRYGAGTVEAFARGGPLPPRLWD